MINPIRLLVREALTRGILLNEVFNIWSELQLNRAFTKMLAIAALLAVHVGLAGKWKIKRILGTVII